MANTKRPTSRRKKPPGIALPKFNLALGEFLALPEHLEQKYSDVVTQIFPLKASMGRLQDFCDTYLNLNPDAPRYFKPAVPWVLMQVVDYGQMAVTSKNLGWFSQHELAFGVPLWCYKKEKDKWVFTDWAMVFPFIFVDNPLSMSGGRKIYGWSKSGIKIDDNLSILEAGSARRLVGISLVTSGTNYGEHSGTEEFLQIYQRRPFMSASTAVSDLFSALPRAIANSITAAYSIFETTGLFPLGYSDRDLESLQQVVARFYGLMNSAAPGSLRAPPEKTSSKQPLESGSGIAPFNIVTMKQIRDVHSSSAACFQAIVGSKMHIDRTIDGGSLFDPLSGDASGGIYINLLDTPVQPIVQMLGLETSEHSSVGGRPAATLRPMMPFWVKMDLSYGLADSQYWRTNATGWTTGDTLKQTPRREIEYLNIGSGASEEVSGPYHFPKMTLRVMPLRAEQNKLQNLLDRYLENDFFQFEVAGQIKDELGLHGVVCLIGANFEEMTAAGDPGTKYSDRELTFAVPVLWSEKRTPRIKSPALIPLYIFSGTDWNAVTSYEVYGQLSLKSKFVSPDSSWLVDATGPRKAEPLVTVKTELFPELGKSQEAKNTTVLEVFSAPGAADRGSIQSYLKELGLGHFLTGNEFHSISLKQVMDAKDCGRANYQAVVALLRQFTGIKDSAGNATTGKLAPLSVKVFDYPTFPIVGGLGLIPEACDDTGPYPIFTLKPIDPFWVSGAMVGDTGLEMCSRVGTSWRRNPTFDTSISEIRKASARKQIATKQKKEKP
jgi:hypothetical protein